RRIIQWWHRTTPGAAPRSPGRSVSEPCLAPPTTVRGSPRRRARLVPAWTGNWTAVTRIGYAHARRQGAGTARQCRARLIAGDPMESRIERLCVERGLKMTGQRRVIARVLSEASDHPDVEELYRRASVLDARISIATVYRTVRLLEEKGILDRRDFGGG